MQAKKEFLDAIKTDNLQIVDKHLSQKLIELNEEIRYCSGRTTPLHLACYLGRYAVVDRLIKAQADVNLLTSRNESPLFFAVQNGHLKVVDLLIRAQADLDIQQFQGASPMHIAAQDNWPDVVYHLARSQADLNLRQSNGCSPLYIACQDGSVEFVRKLIKAGVDVNLQTESGETPLLAAVQFNHRGIVRQLLDAHADVNLPDDEGWSPIFMASQEGYLKVLQMLIAAQADVDLLSKDETTALFIAAKAGQYHIAKALVLAQADVNLQTRNGRSALFISAEKGNQKLLTFLLNAQADPDAQTCDQKSPLHAATVNGHRQVVQILIKAMANLDCRTEQSMTPLILATQAESRHIIELLINSQADPNTPGLSGETALHAALNRASCELSSLLITARSNLDILDDQGFAPIHLVSKHGDCKLLQALVSANADVNFRSRSGATAAYMATQENHINVLNLLITAQSDLNLGAVEQATPLYIASQDGLQESVKTLIKAQANINTRVLTGQSPLYIACQKGHEKVVNELLKAQADVELQDERGFSPLYMAAQFGHSEVVKALIKSQADVNVLWKFSLAPLHIAAQENHQETVDLLIGAQANVDVQRDTGESPLHLAVHWGHVGVVSSLLTGQAEVDLQEVGEGYSPLLISSQQGHTDITNLLLSSKADSDIRTKSGKSPLHIAAKSGHDRVVELLLEARCTIRPHALDGNTPLELSLAQNHLPVARRLRRAQENFDYCAADSEVIKDSTDIPPVLQPEANLSSKRFEQNSKRFRTKPYLVRFENLTKYGPQPEDTELSLQLHAALTKSGFSETRAAMQSAMADVLETILRNRLNDNEVFVVGSYSEGWGNSLTRMDGRTDFESDIDVVQLMPGRLYNVRRFCQCPNANSRQTTSYYNGHIECEGFASNPARPENGSTLRPAVDRVSACRLCCYPPIGPLQPHRLAKSSIPQTVLQSLTSELEALPCHVVHAAPPGQAGKQLRVSTTFLERRLLRSLTTLQGQLFVTLKFLVKKVIGRRVHGLKAYHAKTVTFRMLEETPEEQWKPENLMTLIRRSVQMLLDSVETSRSADNTDGRIMEHFFLSDAALYLKGADRSSFEEIVQVLRDVIDHLPQLLMSFKNSLYQIGSNNLFHFHPFLILPEIDPKFSTGLHFRDYYSIYDIVRDSFESLVVPDFRREFEASLVKKIGRLPDCARSARESLRALVCLKFNDTVAASDVLLDCNGHIVSRGIKEFASRPAEGSGESAVFNQLCNSDLAWRFSFMFLNRPDLSSLLPDHLATWFPLRMENYVAYYYINFDCLLLCLSCELRVKSAEARNAWLLGLLLRDEADIQELLTAMRYCSDHSLALSVIRKFQTSIQSHELTSKELIRFQQERLLADLPQAF